MINTTKLFKTIFEDIKQETVKNPIFISTILVLLSIPMPIFVNNFFILLFTTISLLNFKKENFKLEFDVILPILLYFLMIFSIFWTIDSSRTLTALIKELPLILFPICFLLAKKLSEKQTSKIIQYYSFGIVLFSVYYLVNALIRYIDSSNIQVFYYHELVTKLVNAIHVSVYVAIAFFYFFTKMNKNSFDYLALIVLFSMVFLLSSNNIIFVFIALIIIYHLFYTKTSKQLRLKNLLIVGVILISFAFIGKLKERLQHEYIAMTTDSTVNDVISKGNATIYNVSIKQAWTNATFKSNDFFPGTAFRIYQLRIFLEMMQENNIFWSGFGLNASYKKIEEKGIKHNIYLGNNEEDGYQKKNFHNQYVQNFAELGVFGFLVLVIMLGVNLKNGIINKDFIHISFAVLMISLFLTESFLWRQRGVVFFTIMYCLFNTRNLKLIANK